MNNWLIRTSSDSPPATKSFAAIADDIGADHLKDLMFLTKALTRDEAFADLTNTVDPDTIVEIFDLGDIRDEDAFANNFLSRRPGRHPVTTTNTYPPPGRPATAPVSPILC